VLSYHVLEALANPALRPCTSATRRVAGPLTNRRTASE